MQHNKFYFNFYIIDSLSIAPKFLIVKFREESCFNAESPSPIDFHDSIPKLLLSPIVKFREKSCFNAEIPSPIALPPSGPKLLFTPYCPN